MKTIIPDFKTERNNISPPLPGAMRVIPLLFYTAIVGALGMGSISFLKTKRYQSGEAQARSDEQAEAAKIKGLVVEEEKLNNEAREAREVQSWITGSTEIYPLALKICRSVEQDGSISQLSLNRLEDMPSQIKMNISLYSPMGTRQVEQLTSNVTSALSYRSLSEATAPKKDDPLELDFECIWARVNSASTTTETK
jgi:hypothetical protein